MAHPLEKNGAPSTIPTAVAEDFLWKEALRTALKSAEDLVAEGLIPASQGAAYEPILARYRFLLPRYYANLINKGDPACPIRLQAIPDLREHQDHGLPDPLNDLGYQPEVRITHRYRHRLLLHLTPNCSMYCRYCFRKSLLNELSHEMFNGTLAPAFRYIADHREVEEVIFSGGDPFLANEGQLTEAMNFLKTTAHVKRVRFHSRVPVTLPVRMTERFAKLVATGTGKPTVIVAHFNHPREITPEARLALKRLKDEGAMLFNQSVLLRGVNDSLSTLEALSLGLFESGCLPYYLHHPDNAAGTAYFEVEKRRGLQVWRELKERLPGYLVPRYVVDMVGMPYKLDVEASLNRHSGLDIPPTVGPSL